MDREELAVELQKLIREIQHGFRPPRTTLPLRPGEMRALWIVARHGPMEKSELAENLGISKSLVSSVARRLEDLGMITQTVPAQDRRRRIIELSNKGKEALDDMKALRRERMARLFERLTPDEQELLYKLLVKIRGPISDDAL
ncbi:MAG: MarR family winged helix-turn-helix transcriptional regulator [Sulfobacillus sp.]